MSFTQLMIRLQMEARNTPLGHRSPKHALYAMLGHCMSLAQRADNDPQEQAELHRLVRLDNQHNKKGRWVEKDSDSYLLVCRFVFYDPKRHGQERTTAWRYATVLREAAKRQILPQKLPQYLNENGGMNSLVRSRPGQEERRILVSKTIELSRSVELPTNGGEFTLTLYYDRRTGRFVPVSN